MAYNRRSTEDASAGSAAERLQPVTNPLAIGVVRLRVYVPIYSSLYLGRDIKNDMVQLTSTLSVGRVITNEPQ